MSNYLFPEDAKKAPDDIKTMLKQYLDGMLSEEYMLSQYKDCLDEQAMLYVIIANKWCFELDNNGQNVYPRYTEIIRFLFANEPKEQETFDYLFDCLIQSLPFSSLN